MPNASAGVLMPAVSQINALWGTKDTPLLRGSLVQFFCMYDTHGS